MEEATGWLKRFSDWVQYEPVRAAEEIRMLLVSVTALVGIQLGDPVITSIMGVITAAFSIWASKKSRDSVMPVKRVEENYVDRQEVAHLDV